MAFVISYAFSMPFYQHGVVGSQGRSGGQEQPRKPEKDTVSSPKKPLWRVQRTLPVTWHDLDSSTLDLQMPLNLRRQVFYNDTLDSYFLGKRLGGTYLAAPIMMSPKEYLDWSGRQQQHAFFRSKNTEIYETKGKEKFDFSDMHFDLGPAEKILVRAVCGFARRERPN